MAKARENYREDVAGRANVEDTPELDAYYNELEKFDAAALWTVANKIEPPAPVVEGPRPLTAAGDPAPLAPGAEPPMNTLRPSRYSTNTPTPLGSPLLAWYPNSLISVFSPLLPLSLMLTGE